MAICIIIVCHASLSEEKHIRCRGHLHVELVHRDKNKIITKYTEANLKSSKDHIVPTVEVKTMKLVFGFCDEFWLVFK